MILERINLEHEYMVDIITHNGFKIESDSDVAPNLDEMIDSSEFTNTEYRCECGAFTGQDVIGLKCPRCGTEICLHSLNFQYTGWFDIAPNHVIAPLYYKVLNRVLKKEVLRFILGDYKSDISVPYNENDTKYYENKKKRKKGRLSTNDLEYIKGRVPSTKQIYEGLGHNEFYNRFEEIMSSFMTKSNKDDIDMLIKNKSSVFTSKIPVYSSVFRPTLRTAESMYYSKVNKMFKYIAADYCRLNNVVMPYETIQILNSIQNRWLEATDYLIKEEMSSKTGYVRSEIVGGTFEFSGRGVITLDVSLPADSVDLPVSMCLTAYQYKVTHMLAVRYNMTLEQAYLYTKSWKKHPIVLDLLQEIINDEQWIFIIREPANNIASIEACKVRRFKIDDDTISLPPETLSGFNADFDGDALNIGFIPKECVPDFMPFYCSYMVDYVSGDVNIDYKEWIDICLGILTDD